MDAYSSCGLTKGTVVKRDDNVTAALLAVLRRSHADGATIRTMIGAAFSVPRKLTGTKFIANVYDVAGRLVYSAPVTARGFTLPKNIRAAENVYIVDLKAMKN
jgi:hypothetical protein